MFDEHEPAEPEVAADLKALEQQLAQIAPMALRIDRDQLMFEAGRASVAQPKRLGYIADPSRVGARFWPAATATMTAATVLLATMLVWQRQNPPLAIQQTPPEVVASRSAAKGPAAPTDSARAEISMAYSSSLPQSTTGYLGMRYIALTRGIGATEPTVAAAIGPHDPELDMGPVAPPTSRGLMDQLLPAANRNAPPRS